MFRDIKGRARRRPLMDGTGTGVALATPHTGRRAWGRGGCEKEGWPKMGRDGGHKGGGYEEGVSKVGIDLTHPLWVVHLILLYRG